VKKGGPTYGLNGQLVQSWGPVNFFCFRNVIWIFYALMGRMFFNPLQPPPTTTTKPPFFALIASTMTFASCISLR